MIAKYPGTCQKCRSRFDAGAEIRGSVGRSGYQHAVCPQQQPEIRVTSPWELAEQELAEQKVAPKARPEQSGAREKQPQLRRPWPNGAAITDYDEEAWTNDAGISIVSKAHRYWAAYQRSEVD